jgi:hypothetical protein
MKRIIFAAVLAVASTGLASAQDSGIAACDDFYKQYEVCVSTKMPEAQRAMFKQQIDMAKAQLKEAAANPAAKAQMEQSCTAQKAQMATAMKPYGCEFK